MYTVTGFLDKNKDNIQPEIYELFIAAKVTMRLFATTGCP
jgi:myosin heavy subunit